MGNKRGKQELIPDNTPVIQSQFFKGPFPPPETLARYEAAQSGLIDRIFRYAELEQSHRHDIQKMQAITDGFDVRSNFWVHIIVTICITLMYITMIAAGCYSLSLGYIKTALTILAFPVGRAAVSLTLMARRTSESSRKK